MAVQGKGMVIYAGKQKTILVATGSMGNSVDGLGQSSQPLPGILDFGQAGVGVLPGQTLINTDRYHFPILTKLSFFD
jgi:hypothetical protein